MKKTLNEQQTEGSANQRTSARGLEAFELGSCQSVRSRVPRISLCVLVVNDRVQIRVSLHVFHSFSSVKIFATNMLKIDVTSPAWTVNSCAGECVVFQGSVVNLASSSKSRDSLAGNRAQILNEAVNLANIGARRSFDQNVGVGRIVPGVATVRTTDPASEPSVDEETAPGWAVFHVQKFRDHRGKWRTSRRCWPTSATWWLWRRAKAHRPLVQARKSFCPIPGICRDISRSDQLFANPSTPVSPVAMGMTYSWTML